MKICSKCHVLCRDICPKCATAKHLAIPEENQPALLIVLTTMQSMLVEPMLAESGIPYFKKGMVGGALAAKIGMMREIYSFFVPCSAQEKCRALIEDVFVEDEEIMRALHEFDIKEEA